MTVGIFHLVRAANGRAPFDTFLRSLRAARAPHVPWKLVLICKGFADRADTQPYLDAVADLPHEAVHISDAGFDISSYFRATEATAFEVCAYFNSFCRIVSPDWFELMYRTLMELGVGLVGATGSLESVVRNHLVYGRTERGLVGKAKKYAIAAGLAPLFPPFPNAHVRTNAFMIRRDHFLATKKFPLNRRLAALYYESGWFSLTRQVQAMGLDVLVVDRAGRALPPDGWADAGTFRSGTQSEVLVEDNRTREYADAPPERQRLLRELAFGQGTRS